MSLMEDQTNFLRKFGISAGPIGEDKALDLRIEKGGCSVVFSSPGSLLGNGRWRRRFPGKTGPLYEKYNCVNSLFFFLFFPIFATGLSVGGEKKFLPMFTHARNARTTTEAPGCLTTLTTVYSTIETVGGNPVRLVIMAPLSLLVKGI